MAWISLQFNGVFTEILCETDQCIDTKCAGRCARSQSDAESLTALTVRNLRSPGFCENPMCSTNSYNAILREFPKDMPVEDSTTYKPHTLTHHFE